MPSSIAEPPHDQGPRPPGRRQTIEVALLCVATLALCVTSLDYDIFWCDNVYHVVGAWSLAAGEGFRNLARPDAPPLLKYPPGYALTLVPLVWWMGNAFKWYRLGSILPYVACLPFIHSLMRRRMSHRGAWVVTALFAVHPTMLFSVHLLCQGGHHLLVFFAAVWLLERAEEGHALEGRWLVSLIVLLAAGFYLHRIGLMLIVVAVGALAHKSTTRREALLVALGTGLLVSPWIIRSWLYSATLVGPEYEGEIAGRIESEAPGAGRAAALGLHVVRNLLTVPREMGEGLFTGLELGHVQAAVERFHLGSWVNALECAIGTVTIAGFLMVWRRRPRFYDIYAVCHMAMLLVFFPSFKYMTFLAPLLWHDLLEGTRALWLIFARRPIHPRIARVLAAALLVTTVARDRFFFAHISFPPVDREAKRWEWVREAVGEHETIVCLGMPPFPEMIYLYTSRRVLPLLDGAVGRPVPTADGRPVGDYLLLARGRDPAVAMARFPGLEARPVAHDDGSLAILYRLFPRRP